MLIKCKKKYRLKKNESSYEVSELFRELSNNIEDAIKKKFSNRYVLKHYDARDTAFNTCSYHLHDNKERKTYKFFYEYRTKMWHNHQDILIDEHIIQQDRLECLREIIKITNLDIDIKL